MKYTREHIVGMVPTDITNSCWVLVSTLQDHPDIPYRPASGLGKRSAEALERVGIVREVGTGVYSLITNSEVIL